ncbi:MAG: hypothetical protein HFH49_16055 [Lachnospiraceae bacterium]|nr:hypothetical protein [Lachnospiraceae bacterium]
MEKFTKKYLPILQVLLFLFMLVFLIHYFKNKKDWREIALEVEAQAGEKGTYEETANGRDESPDEIEQAQMKPSDLKGNSVSAGRPDRTENSVSARQTNRTENSASANQQALPGNSAATGQMALPGQSAAEGQSTLPGQPAAEGQLTLPGQPAAEAQSILPGLLAAPIREEDIYSFLQGPQSWSGGVSWSGEWCRFEVDGNSFGSFGCGLCCMANVYNTLSPYEVSPWDMYEHAKISSGYTPGGGYGAIDWQEMRCTLETCGISGELHSKPETYEEFRQQIREAKSAIVLVCSGNDNSFWAATQGHYVNIWLYQEDDTVFLADPGNREKNRSRIPLRYVYDALKTGSTFQYFAVKNYAEAENMWRADGIEEDWCRP